MPNTAQAPPSNSNAYLFSRTCAKQAGASSLAYVACNCAARSQKDAAHAGRRMHQTRQHVSALARALRHSLFSKCTTCVFLRLLGRRLRWRNSHHDQRHGPTPGRRVATHIDPISAAKLQISSTHGRELSFNPQRPTPGRKRA